MHRSSEVYYFWWHYFIFLFLLFCWHIIQLLVYQHVFLWLYIDREIDAIEYEVTWLFDWVHGCLILYGSTFFFYCLIISGHYRLLIIVVLSPGVMNLFAKFMPSKVLFDLNPKSKSKMRITHINHFWTPLFMNSSSCWVSPAGYLHLRYFILLWMFAKTIARLISLVALSTRKNTLLLSAIIEAVS